MLLLVRPRTGGLVAAIERGASAVLSSGIPRNRSTPGVSSRKWFNRLCQIDEPPEQTNERLSPQRGISRPTV